jgi:hypothetical protein
VPALDVPFSGHELAAVRAAAERSGQSLRSFVHGAAIAAASEHEHRVAEAARAVAERSAELNRRLAED